MANNNYGSGTKEYHKTLWDRDNDKIIATTKMSADEKRGLARMPEGE
jgi:hypothetical protein